MRYFMGIVMLGIAFGLSIVAYDQFSLALTRAKPPTVTVDSFAGQLALSPHMFDGAMIQDRPDLVGELTGGVIDGATTTRVLIFPATTKSDRGK